MKRPTKHTPSVLPSYSSLWCKTFNGFFGDFSAKPNSSNKIIYIGISSSFLSGYLSLNLSYNFLVLLNKFSISSGIFDFDP